MYISLLLYTERYSNCNIGIRIGQSGCYEIVPVLATWHDASASCESKGGYLLTLETAEEEQDIRTHLPYYEGRVYSSYDGLSSAVWLHLNIRLKWTCNVTS